jgi:neutral ceramidase
LAAYINVTLSWIPSLGSSSTIKPPLGPEPPDNTNRSLSFIPSVIRDAPPFFKNFGNIVQDVTEVNGGIYEKGEAVTAKFVGANPRNNLRLGGSYAVVEKLVSSTTTVNTTTARNEAEPGVPEEFGREQWQVVRDDSDWHLVFRWRRVSELLATSEVNITWETVDPWAEAGEYRFRYFGDAKSLGGTITPFEGVSGTFRLVEPSS